MRGILQLAAWLSLIAGLVASLFTFFSAAQFGGMGSLAVAAGLGYLFSSFVVWALLLVIVQMSDRLERIEGSVATLQQRPQAATNRKSYSVVDRL